MDRNADVIVIGAGGAGLTAALTAAEAGLRVLLMEKEGDVGGSTLMSGGSFALAGTDVQEANGVVSPSINFSKPTRASAARRMTAGRSGCGAGRA
jgi:urocanate reductase